jgi:hypothetical protein
MQIRNSVRAGLIALAPLAVFHAAMAANRIAGNVATGAPLPPPDTALLMIASRIVIDAVMLAAGHMTLRWVDLGSRAAYGVMGALAGAAAYAAALHLGISTSTPVAGALVTAAIVPAVIGMISGFLYAYLAGREGTDTTALRMQALPAPDASEEDALPAPSKPPVPATYDGPLQVRTSFIAIVIAALVPALVVTALAVPLILLSGMPAGLFLAAPAQMFVTALLVTVVPAALVVAASHAIARSLGRTRGRDYAAIAGVLNLLPACLLLAMVSAAMLFPVAAVIGAIMGATYRRFAAIEPLALPEDVLARDPRTLVGADHPARRTHAVIMNG